MVNTISPTTPNFNIISKTDSSGIGIFDFSAILTKANTIIAGIKNIAIITILAFSTPVLNTIKSLIFNLESFGYQININEEDLSNAVKITIEVEK